MSRNNYSEYYDNYSRDRNDSYYGDDYYRDYENNEYTLSKEDTSKKASASKVDIIKFSENADLEDQISENNTKIKQQIDVWKKKGDYLNSLIKEFNDTFIYLFKINRLHLNPYPLNHYKLMDPDGNDLHKNITTSIYHKESGNLKISFDPLKNLIECNYEKDISFHDKDTLCYKGKYNIYNNKWIKLDVLDRLKGKFTRRQDGLKTLWSSITNSYQLLDKKTLVAATATITATMQNMLFPPLPLILFVLLGINMLNNGQILYDKSIKKIESRYSESESYFYSLNKNKFEEMLGIGKPSNLISALEEKINKGMKEDKKIFSMDQLNAIIYQRLLGINFANMIDDEVRKLDELKDAASDDEDEWRYANEILSIFGFFYIDVKEGEGNYSFTDPNTGMKYDNISEPDGSEVPDYGNLYNKLMDIDNRKRIRLWKYEGSFIFSLLQEESTNDNEFSNRYLIYNLYRYYSQGMLESVDFNGIEYDDDGDTKVLNPEQIKILKENLIKVFEDLNDTYRYECTRHNLHSKNDIITINKPDLLYSIPSDTIFRKPIFNEEYKNHINEIEINSTMPWVKSKLSSIKNHLSITYQENIWKNILLNNNPNNNELENKSFKAKKILNMLGGAQSGGVDRPHAAASVGVERAPSITKDEVEVLLNEQPNSAISKLLYEILRAIGDRDGTGSKQPIAISICDNGSGLGAGGNGGDDDGPPKKGKPFKGPEPEPEPEPQPVVEEKQKQQQQKKEKGEEEEEGGGG